MISPWLMCGLLATASFHVTFSSDVDAIAGTQSPDHLSGAGEERSEPSNSTVVTNKGLVSPREKDDEPNCTVIADFISATSDVLSCVATMSTPATYCTECKAQFKVWHHFLELMNNKTSCQKLLSDDSSVATSPSLLGRIANQTESYWTDSRCENCVHMNQSDLVQFRQLDANLSTCLAATNGTEACANCLPIYKDLSQMYLDLGNGHGCVELKDRLNRTQHAWNDKGCKPPTPDITTAMILSGFFAILPAVFYTYLRIFGSRRTRKLLRANNNPSTPGGPPPTTSTGAVLSGQTQPLLPAEGAAGSSTRA